MGIAGRMFYLQIIKGDYYAALARGQHTEYIERDPPRGNIFFEDKFAASAPETDTMKSGPATAGQDGLFVAATNKEWPLLYAVPREITDARAVASQLAPLLYRALSSSYNDELDSEDAVSQLEESVYQRLGNKEDSYEPLAHKLEKEIAEEIEALDLEGIYTAKELLRYYPAKELGARMLGFVGYEENERVGQYGVEGFYEDFLRGTKGVSEIPLLSFRGERKELTRPGDDLLLSIDYNIQFMLEEKLKDVKEKFEAEGASAIVMDPKTGELIAIAQADSFDPNRYWQVETLDIFLNDAVQKMFEPGSVMKPFTMAAALDQGLLSPTTEYTDKGYVRVGAYTIKNSDEKTYGRKTMTNVLEFSINTGAVFVEQLVGHDIFREYLGRFGFGIWTEIDLQGEVPGDIQNILLTSRDINFATASFGQGIAVTPIQLLAGFAAFANGGDIMKPHVVNEIVSASGARTVVEPVVTGSPITPKTAAQITSMLVSVVEHGYGKKAAVKGYKVAAKTGTAQVPNEEGGGYSEDKTIHSLVGFAPAYNPRFIALIKVDNPQGVDFASESIAPLFSEIAEYILHYYEIPPDAE